MGIGMTRKTPKPGKHNKTWLFAALALRTAQDLRTSAADILGVGHRRLVFHNACHTAGCLPRCCPDWRQGPAGVVNITQLAAIHTQPADVYVIS
jgi:hypothetical protein